MFRFITVAVLGLFVINGDVLADKGKGKGGNGSQTAQAKIEGTITGVGPTSVTIRPRAGAVRTIIVNAATKVERNDRHVRLAAFKVGDRGEALFDPTTMIGSKVEAVGN
jgi:hypothetical protein